MRRESLRSYRERCSARLRGHDEETGKRRYRGFLPNYLRNYAISYLREQAPKHDARKHYAMRRMFDEAVKDYALTLRYAAKAESARVAQRVRHNLMKGEDRRWVLLADETKPLVSLFENDINQVLRPIGIEAYISFRPFFRECDPDEARALRQRLQKKWRKMAPSSTKVAFREKDQSTTGTQTSSNGEQAAKAISILSKLQLTPRAKVYLFRRGPARALREIEGLQEGSYCLRCLNEGRGLRKTSLDPNANVYVCDICSSAQGCPGISVFMLFSDVVAAGDPSVYLGKRASFGSTCLLEGRNEASPISASHPSHAHNGVKSPNNGTPPRAKSSRMRVAL